ncbi:MAG: hypothetical protein FWG68_12705 [Defluviitaleaceae bacterium]|nr:hypothetical protein [Defluviitaleaceae bacterium]
MKKTNFFEQLKQENGNDYEHTANIPHILRFGDNDLVYGPSAGSNLEKFCKKYGGKTLTDFADPFSAGYDNEWAKYSISIIEEWCKKGLFIHFDLTYMEDIENILNNAGTFAECTTSHELRHIHQNWNKLSNTVKFYKNEKEVQPPWIKK